MKKGLIVKNKTLIIAVSIAAILIIVAAVITIVVVSKPKSQISSFQECANAGYPIQQSFPEVCSVPSGKSFIDN